MWKHAVLQMITNVKEVSWQIKTKNKDKYIAQISDIIRKNWMNEMLNETNMRKYSIFRRLEVARILEGENLEML